MKVSEYLAGLTIGVPFSQGAPVKKAVSLKPLTDNSDDKRQVLTVELLVESGDLELDDQE